MSTLLRTLVREIVQEELLKGKNKKELIRALAQDIIDEVRPGETVQEVLINTNSAEPIEGVIEQAKEIVENAKKQPVKKTVYQIWYKSQMCSQAWPSTEYREDYDSFEDAAEVIKHEKIGFYFVAQREVDA